MDPLSPFSTPVKKKKKKNKKKAGDLDDTLLPPSTPTAETSGKKKRKMSITSDLESVVDLSFQSSPKKKKKKSKKKEEEPNEDNISLSEAEATPRSAKKKNNHSFNVSLATEMDKDGFSTPGRAGSEKKKKKKKRKSHKINGDLESNIELESNTWPLEEEYLFIDSLLEKLDPCDTAPYKKTLRNLDWSSLSVSDRSPDKCEKKLMELLTPVEKVKSLVVLLKEARELAGNEEKRLKTSLLPPKTLFKQDFFKEHAGEDNFVKLNARACEAWEKLTVEEKQFYEDKQNLHIKHYKKVRDIPPEPPKRPFSYYYDSQRREGNNENQKQLLTAFKAMDPEAKAKYMHICMKDWILFKQEFDQYKESHPDFQERFPTPSGRPLFEEYLYYLGMPKPLTTIKAMFYHDQEKKGKFKDIDPKAKIMVSDKMYKDLSNEKQEKYARKYAKEKEKYRKEYKEWWDRIDEDVKIFMGTIFKPSKKTESNEPVSFTNFQEMAIAKPKFSDEPEKPPLSPYAIFSMKFEKLRKEKYSSTKEMRVACRDAWLSMSKDKKAKYAERQKECLGIYKEKVLEYVAGLGSAKVLYIGFNRKPLSKLFKEDILEDHYPNVDYPVYVLVKKEVGTLKSVVRMEELDKLNDESKSKGMGLVDDSDSCKNHSIASDAGFDDEDFEQMVEPKEEVQVAEDSMEEEDEEDDEEY